MSDLIYLDNAATTRPLATVVEAMADAQRELFGNPVASTGSWPSENPYLLSILWIVLITAVFMLKPRPAFMAWRGDKTLLQQTYFSVGGGFVLNRDRMGNAFMANTRPWHSIFRRNPVGWGNRTRKRLHRVIADADPEHGGSVVLRKMHRLGQRADGAAGHPVCQDHQDPGGNVAGGEALRRVRHIEFIYVGGLVEHRYRWGVFGGATRLLGRFARR